MRTAEDFINACNQEVGYIEEPINRTKFAAIAGHRNGQPWCHTFLVAKARQTGVDLPPGVADTAYTPSGVAAWKRAGRWFTDPKPGDWAYFDFPDNVRRVQHVGVVVSANSTTHIIVTIEGNTSAGRSGSQTNGGGVFRRIRGTGTVVGYGRPWYRIPYAPKRRDSNNQKDGDTMRMFIDTRDGTVWLFGAGAPKSLGGKPDHYQRLLDAGIPVSEDDGLIIDFLLSS